MQKTTHVAILIFDDVEVLDFAGPFEVFSVAAERITDDTIPMFNPYTVGLTEQMIVARGGLRVQPQYSLDNCPPPDLVVVPGGRGTRRLLNNQRLIDWLNAQVGTAQQITSVCTGALILAQAGLLQNIPATTHHGSFGLLATLSPSTKVIDKQRYVQHERIVTSAGVSAGIDMALHVVESMFGAEQVKLVTDEMEWRWYQES